MPASAFVLATGDGKLHRFESGGTVALARAPVVAWDDHLAPARRADA